MGAPQGLYAYARFAGCLPWTTYARLGFEPFLLHDQDALPGWAQGAAPPDVVAEAQAALQAGRPPSSFHTRLMAFGLPQHARKGPHV
jgi:hypothetical protein